MTKTFIVKDDLLTGHGLMDEQHSEFFDRLNQLLQAVDGKKSAREIQGFIRFLADYLQTHLAMEEKMMAAHGYPGFEAHKKQHDLFRSTYQTMMSDFASGKYSLQAFLEVLEHEVGDWFTNHIKGVDRKMASFMLEKGVLAPE